MALIAESKEGRKDGGYSRIIGNVELGALMSRTQATVISAGTELEKIITKRCHPLTESQLGDFLSGKLPDGNYLITKKMIKNQLKSLLKCDIEPDFVYLVIDNGVAYIIELKDGDTFDTKKSAAEVESLKSFTQQFLKFCLSNHLQITQVRFKVCCFNQSNKQVIVAGLKGCIGVSEAMTGKELCDLLGICYQDVISEREQDARNNFEYFKKEALRIFAAYP